MMKIHFIFLMMKFKKEMQTKENDINDEFVKPQV